MNNNSQQSQSNANSSNANANANDQNQTEWNEIVSWLQSLNYSHYAPLFKSGGYDLWEIIFDLTPSDLREIGIKPGHSNRIQKSLKFKKQQQHQMATKQSQQPVACSSPPKATITSIQNAAAAASNHQQMNVSKVSSPKTVTTQTTTQTNSSTNSILPISKVQASNSNAALPQIQQLQQLQLEERKRKIRDRFQQNAFFAGGIKNKLFETMKRVLNGLQQELIQYNGKFAEPINEMNQRIVALQRLDVHNLDGIWDSNDGLFEPMMRNIKEIKKFNHSMWTKINEFHALTESQLKNATKSLQQQINVINNMKTQYLIKQQHINALQRQFAINQNAKALNNGRQPPLNTIMVNTSKQPTLQKEASPGSMVTNFQVTNVYNNNSMNANPTQLQLNGLSNINLVQNATGKNAKKKSKKHHHRKKRK